MKYPELFKPLQIGKVEIKNRIVMSPVLTVGWYDEDGIITNEIINYYEERAKGGVGAIFTNGNMPPAGLEESSWSSSPFRKPAKFISQMRKLSDRLHQYGTKLFIQIWFGSGRVIFPQLVAGEAIAASEGENRWNPSIKCRALTTQEVENLIASTIEAAKLCQMSGCDGVDINGAYGGYLGDQFATEAFNKRKDEYGNNIDGQLKLLTKVIKGIKEACGEQFPVTVRFSSKHHMKGERQGAVPGEVYKEFGRDIEQSIKMAQKLEAAGYDGFLMGNGSYDSIYWLYPPMYQKDGLWIDEVAKIKEVVNVPVICPGKIVEPEMANTAIHENKIDAVALGRALLADPQWANKAKQGDDDNIRPCIGCNTGCLGRIFNVLPLQCAVNPDLMNEKNSHLVKAEKAKKIAIIGGGIASMEAARVAAKRGHDVTIYEKKDKLGGVFFAAAIPEFKVADRRLLKWYNKQLQNSGVKVLLNTELTLEEILQLDVDEIVVATGATPKIPPISGIHQAHTMTAVDALLNEKEIGQKVVIIGGGQVGCELALTLQQHKKEVTLVEYMDQLMCGSKEPICVANKMMLEDMLQFEHVNIQLNSSVSKISGHSVELKTPNGNKYYEADTIILSTGYTANNKLYKQIYAQTSKNVWLIGDAKLPSNIMHAIKDGSAIGKIL